MKGNVLFISHGGGPMPLLGDARHTEMISTLQNIASDIRKPDAILVISAHWEESVVTITSNPKLIYDYYGFPEQAYQIQYPCAGEHELADKILESFKNNNIDSKLDSERGFDHGLYVPLKIMLPDANIPCVQVSLKNNLNPAEHIQIGKALQNVDCDNLLVIGSGFSFHNMKAFFTPDTKETKLQNSEFEHWLLDTCNNQNIEEIEREQRLVKWQNAPHARYCHPREEHLLPLHVCYGFAQQPASQSFELSILNKKTSMYLWEI